MPACCGPQGQCGFDPIGLGLNCVPNPGEKTGRVCDLPKCPETTTGHKCCTPYAECGYDPTDTGAFCFPLPESNVDAGNSATCDLPNCPMNDGGPAACCTDDGKCGFDSLGVGLCEAPDAGAVDAGAPKPPNDPSITGECPNFLDFDNSLDLGLLQPSTAHVRNV